MRIAVWAPDLMDRSRFGALQSTAEVTFVGSAIELAEAIADVAVADLGRPNAVEALVESPAERKVGYISHVMADQKTSATSTGIEVHNRSVFFSRIVSTLSHAK